MSSSVPVSASLAAIVERWKKEARPDPIAEAYEQGAIPTKPAKAPSQKAMRPSRILPRPRKRFLTDEERIKRRNRKRMLGGSSALPDTIRHHYTEGERAVLSVVAGEVKRQGICDLSIDEIADRAGVRRTTVQNAMHEGHRQGHLQIIERPRRGAKSETNVVKIISAEWREWIKRAPSAAQRIGSKFSKNLSTSESIDKTNTDSTKQRRQRIEAAWRWGRRWKGSARSSDPLLEGSDVV